MRNLIAFIGDIHGEYEKMMSVIDQLQVYSGRLTDIVFLGDYIDRGSKSKEVLDYLFGLEQLYGANVTLLKGNHEELMILSHTRNFADGKAIWYANGGRDTELSLLRDTKPTPTWKTIENYCNLIKRYCKPFFHKRLANGWELWAVHGNLSARIIKEIKEGGDPEIWDSFYLWDKDYQWTRMPENIILIHGHTIEPKVREYKRRNTRRIAVDTGSFLPNGRISCVVFNVDTAEIEEILESEVLK